MSLLDWLIVALVALLAVRGFSAGFISGVVSLAGLGAGAYLGSRLARYLVQSEPDFAAYSSFVLLLSALFLAGLSRAVAGSIGGRIGASVRRVPGVGSLLGALDGVGGAALGAAVGLFFVWVAGVFALQGPLPQPVRGSVEDSGILLAMNDRLPAGFLLDMVAGLDPMPEIEGPRPQVAEPEPPDANNSPSVENAAGSVVQIVATGGSGASLGYGSGSSGSGWVAAPELVVTNAHVVAGNDRVAIRREGAWRGYEAEVVAVDETNDVAVLAVDGMDLPVLPATEPEPGEPVAIVGYPYGGPLDIEPGRIGGTSQAITRDAYGNGPVNRYITSIRGEANPGNSGGPVVNEEGEVVGTVFANAGYGGVAYSILPAVVSEQLELAQARAASTNEWEDAA